MSITALAPAEIAAPQIAEVAEPMTQLDHMFNYGRALFGVMSDKLISVGNAIRHPNRVVATAEATAALGGLGLGGTVAALAQEAPPATPASAIKFHSPYDISWAPVFQHAKKRCLQRGTLNIDPNANPDHNPTALHHSKYGKAWISISQDKETQTLHIRPKKGFESCLTLITAKNADLYIVPNNLFTSPKHSPGYHPVDYEDPIKMDDSSGHAIAVANIMFKKQPKAHH